MAVILPELLLPSSIPNWLSNSHVHELVSIYADIEWRAGPNTKRRTYTTAPRLVSVALDLSQAQMTEFHYWYETTCRGGSEWFSTQLANFGPGLLWFKVRFFQPYTAIPDVNGLRWQVQAKLLALGDGSFLGPVSSSFSSTRTLALSGNGGITILAQFSSSRRLSMAAFAQFSSTREMQLQGSATGTRRPIVYLDQETGGFDILQENGDRIIVETAP